MPPNADMRAITTLPRASWRGLRFPWYMAAQLHMKNRLPERHYYGVDIAAHDWTGTDWPPISFKIRFSNGVLPEAHGLGVKLFPDYWQTFLLQILDGEPGDLDHPLIGVVRARVDSWNTEATTQDLSGIELNITFVRTNEDPGVVEALDVGGGDPTRLAQLVANYIAPFGLTLASKRAAQIRQSTYGTTDPSIVQVWSSLSRSISIDLGFLTAIWALIADLDSLVDDLLLLDDVSTWEALRWCRAFRRYLNTAALSLAQANRPTGTRAISEPTTLDAWARTTKMTLPEAMALNIPVMKRPRIERGTALRYYLTRGSV